jgi:hypothetical protein
MTEFDFLRKMFIRLQDAQRLDAALKQYDPKVVDKAASCAIEATIRDYLELRSKT